MIGQFTGDYRFLSNFFEGPEPVAWLGFDCPTAEHAYQASKAVRDADREMIALASTAGQAKRAGRNIELRNDWESIKLDVMRHVLAVKVAAGTSLAALLLGTGDQLLVEGNTWNDRFWGVCKGQGRNWLGHLLMARRADLRALRELERSAHVKVLYGRVGAVCQGCSVPSMSRYVPLVECPQASALDWMERGAR
jgi:ribA/ribD-fused uncharacterized protein